MEGGAASHQPTEPTSTRHSPTAHSLPALPPPASLVRVGPREASALTREASHGAGPTGCVPERAVALAARWRRRARGASRACLQASAS
jgi:hypothetical protein